MRTSKMASFTTLLARHQEETKILLRQQDNKQQEEDNHMASKSHATAKSQKSLAPNTRTSSERRDNLSCSNSERSKHKRNYHTSAKMPPHQTPPVASCWFRQRGRPLLTSSPLLLLLPPLLLLLITCLHLSPTLASGQSIVVPDSTQAKQQAATAAAAAPQLEQQQQQKQQQPESMALVSAGKQESSSAAATNVILIKYANVTNNKQTTGEPDDQQQQQEQLHLFKLYEPLSVSIIESKFANSIQLFDVSHNQLSTLPNNLFCPLSNEVRQLNISHNLLENFDCLGLISQAGQLCLSELRVLDMSHNLIKHLPATGVATLANLEVLDLSNNLIESLDELSLATLFKLTRLDLSHNRIQQLHMRIFQKSTSMQVLKLQSNLLQISISQMFLAGLVSLEELDLSRNKISQVNDSAFLEKVNLTRVDLSHNHLSSLHQEVLRVTSVQHATGGYRQRLLHNGQYAGLAPKQTHSHSFSAEFYLANNPFVCDCNLEWMRKFQPHSGAIKRTVLSSASSSPANSGVNRMFPSQQQPQLMDQMLADQPFQQQQQQSQPHHYHHRRQHHHRSYHQYHSGDQMMQLGSYQNDQPSPVIYAESSNNNSSETQSNQQQQGNEQQRTAQNQVQVQGVGQQQQPLQQLQSSYHYARIADLDLIKCTPLFRRNSQARNGAANHHHHYRAVAISSANGQSRALTPSDGAHHNNHHLAATRQDAMIDLLSADSSNFLCRYKNHCFALCHCCEFDACDCEMICPAGCNCYYDSSWQTNIIDCSSNNHTSVPERIPMDVSELHLDGNNIDSVKPNNLIARKSLNVLYLNSSNLKYIANRTFNGLVELTTLYLNDNMLRSLSGYEFEPLAQLRALYLQSNRLDHISNQTFIYLRSLEVLDLSNNRLTAQNLDLFLTIGHHNIRLRQLSIAHNWWSCQCQAINRFRQILKQKFLLAGSVNIVDKNHLRCYYNSTTVGPLILSEGSQQQQQALYGSYQSRQQQQQTQLTEINQCSEILVEHPDAADYNPPLIGAQPSEDVADQAQAPVFPVAPVPGPDYQPSEPPFMDSGAYPPAPSPMDTPPSYVPSSPGHSGGTRSPTGNMPLTSFLLVCVLMVGIMVIAVLIFIFVRQQQQRYHHQHHHKKSSAASTASVSSSASSTAISSLNGKSSGTRHHLHSHHQQHQHHQNLVGTNLHHAHQHHLIMSNGSGAEVRGGALGANNINHHLQQHHALNNHHHHSASSQSNIYAALVSPTHGQSTTVSTAANAHGVAPGALNNHHGNNLYSNSSTTASQSSNGGYFQQQQQQQQQQQYLHHSGAYSVATAAIDGHYGAGGVSGGPVNGSSQASYKTSSLYNAPNCPSAELDGQHDLNWAANLKLPKVKQFMSKLVNKSLALGGLRSSSNSRDELASITSDKIYDAFISYDKRDEAFVMQHLSAELEYGQPQYRIADRYRDLPQPSSAYMAEAITSVIGCSHRTIIVLTEHYLSSDWCRYELQAALHEASLDKSHKIIAVVLDPKCLLDLDADMRALLTTGSGIYQKPSLNGSQLVQLDNNDQQQQQQQQQQLLATLTGSQLVGGGQSQVAQLATSRINFINYNERKFWPKIKQLMPQPRPSTQTLTLTTKN